MSAKVSCPVLRGGESGDARTLPDNQQSLDKFCHHFVAGESGHVLAIEDNRLLALPLADVPSVLDLKTPLQA